MKGISLFSGAGGMDLGFEMAGVDIVAANDSWDMAMKTYCTNRPKDSTEILVGSIESHEDQIIQIAKEHKVNVVFGGPPCQDFSTAGWRTGHGQRADMTTKFISLALKINPEWIVMENVNTIMSIGRRHVERVVYMLERAGYHTRMGILNAAHFGVPQHRKRFFMIARKDEPKMPEFDVLMREDGKVVTVREYHPKITYGYNGTKFYYRHPWSFLRRGIFSVDEPSPTIRGVNRPIPPKYSIHKNDATNVLSTVRPLTTRERSILQTFPDGYEFVGNNTEKEQQIGNSVPPLLAKAVATTIMRL